MIISLIVLFALFCWIQLGKILPSITCYVRESSPVHHDFRLLAVCRGNGRIPLYSVNQEYEAYYELLLSSKAAL